MADIEDELIIRGAERPMESKSDLYDPQIRGEMAPIDRKHFNDPLSDFRGELLHLPKREGLQIGRFFDAREVACQNGSSSICFEEGCEGAAGGRE